MPSARISAMKVRYLKANCTMLSPNETFELHRLHCHDMGMPKMRKRTTRSEAHTKFFQPGQQVIHVLPQGVACTNHQPGNTTPVPTTGSRPKIQCNATIKLTVCMKAQHTAILRVDKDAAMSFGGSNVN
jgi:hypothetical protein